MTFTRIALFAALFLFAVVSGSIGADLYQITSSDGKTVYEKVMFGPVKDGENMTAFDPESKKFVYIYWKRGEDKPKPVGSIWDHRTGEMISLYKFPGVTQPLPAIGNVKDIKFFPGTTEKDFKVKQTGNAD